MSLYCLLSFEKEIFSDVYRFCVGSSCFIVVNNINDIQHIFTHRNIYEQGDIHINQFSLLFKDAFIGFNSNFELSTNNQLKKALKDFLMKIKIIIDMLGFFLEMDINNVSDNISPNFNSKLFVQELCNLLLLKMVEIN